MVKVNSEPVGGGPAPFVPFVFKVNLSPPDPRGDLLIDNADAARAIRADLDAVAKASGVVFSRSEAKNLVILALDPPLSSRLVMKNDLGEPVPA